jgi:CPA2 family monovalent cation:H+ antiporter-2
VLAILGPLLTKESKFIYKVLNKVFRWKEDIKPKNKRKSEMEDAKR